MGDNEDSFKISVVPSEDSYKSICALIVSSLETNKSWVLDSGCSYHWWLSKEYFKTLMLENYEVVRLSNNNAYKIHGVGMVTLKISDDY